MPPARKQTDMFANRAYGSVTETAANTLTFNEIQTGVAIFEKIAWVIHAIDYHVPVAAWNELSGDDDEVIMGLCVSNQITSTALNQMAIVHQLRVGSMASGTVGNLETRDLIRRSEFSSWPGGGLIIPPSPLFAFAQGASLAAAVSVDLLIYYTHMALKADEYWELVESRRLVI